jgi:hypothetical protein
MAKMDKISKIVDELKAGTSASDLLKEISGYEVMMKPHLEQEEIECLPLCRAYFTPQEIAVKVQEIIASGPKVELGSFIHTSKSNHCRTTFSVAFIVLENNLKLLLFSTYSGN